ncbi:hypothetical protein PRIPAC_77284 [Pristionchus pacificus]|uniref:Uncharacterized protein n=1 Tax=Pristionchus pacificus TaxID=54126 RepID=A0A2A6C4J0_PRIPA|nr:hypothetical protein PRIPAC_77284 [Pristionchus pacificus]|eukprot:PDM73059.1 hypothetical protein PRIPAC_39493 [Pristionchus pacificus]
MNLLSHLVLLLSLLYFVTSCAPNGGLVPTPSPGGITDAPGEEEATEPPPGDDAAAEGKRRRRNAMRSSVEQIAHPLPDIHHLVRNDSVKVIVRDGREGR